MTGMIKHLWLGVTLIVAASCLLLFSDLSHRKSPKPSQDAEKVVRIAVMQCSSTMLLDDTVAGITAGLRMGGYADGRNAAISYFNSSGDYTTAATMARDLVSGSYDIVITAGTPTLQAVANANKEGRTIHVFGAVTDPYGSGVGITGPEPSQHPRYLVGIGTFQPVEKTFELAKRMNPTLKIVGVVWTPTEHNSEACLIKARAVCKKLGITLEEANASNTSEVPEALRSLLTRNVEAIWIGGDTVAIAAAPSIINTALKAGVPTFTNDSADVKNNALFGLGASYPEVGRTIGKMTASILSGTDPATMRVDNIVPERLVINTDLLATLDHTWKADDKLKEKALQSQKVDHSALMAAQPGRNYRITILYSTPHKLFDDGIDGIRKAFSDNGYTEGKNLTLSIAHANGDASIMQQIAQNAAASDGDLVIALSTPTLASVCGRVKDKPIVFGIVTEPIGAGAGKSNKDHLPNVTGSIAPAPLRGGFEWLMKLRPDIKKIGMIYTPSEANAVTEVNITKEFAKEMGFSLVLRTASSAAEVPEALTSVVSEGIDAYFLEGDNFIMSATPLIVQTCNKLHIPILGDDDSEMGDGQLLAVGVQAYANGYDAAEMAMRVLNGEDPATMPFMPCTISETCIDMKAAASLGIQFPNELIQEAAIIHNAAARFDRPAKIAFVTYCSNPQLDLAREGFLDALNRIGLVDGQDYTLEDFNAQNDMSMLSQVLDSAISTAPDLIVTNGTPTAAAAAGKHTDIPIFFTVCSAPDQIHIEDAVATHHVSGIYENSPVDALLQLTQRECPGISKIGIIYSPSEINARIAVEKLRKLCAEAKMELVEKTAASAADVSDATRALLAAHVGAILSSADNLITTCMPAVAKLAHAEGVPVFADSPNLVNSGADATIGNDYREWGRRTGTMAAKFIAGLPMSAMPPQALDKDAIIERHAEKIAVPIPTIATAQIRKKWVLRIVAYNDTSFVEQSHEGLLAGLKASGLKEGRDYEVRYLNAQGDMSTLTSIMNAVRSDQADMLMCITTPALQAALRQIPSSTAIVFTGVGDGVKAGAGKSETEHQSNVTGITTKSPFEGMAKLIHQCMPEAKAVGTIFTPAEVNSVLYKDWLSEALAKYGISLKEVPVTSSAETSESAASLCAENIDAVCQIVDNTTRPGFAMIVAKADAAGLPTFCFESSQVKDGAVLALARDYYQAAREAAAKAVRIMKGEKAADIPFSNTQTETLTVNVGAAAKHHLNLPAELLRKADRFVNVADRYGRPAKVAIINMADNTALDDAQKGVLEGLADMGLVKGEDFIPTYYNAHGELTQLPQIIGAAQSEAPDLLIPIGTPTIQALCKKGSSIPAAFTIGCDPAEDGDTKSVEEGWITGVYLNTPMRELVDMAMRRIPGLKRVGVIFNPGEYIANDAVVRMRTCCRESGIELVEKPVAAITDAPDAARALIADDVQAILESSDSIMNAALPAVVHVTQPAGVPIFTNETSLLQSGATACIGYSFEDWGRGGGIVAARMLAGLRASDIPPAHLDRKYLREVPEE